MVNHKKAVSSNVRAGKKSAEHEKRFGENKTMKEAAGGRGDRRLGSMAKAQMDERKGESSSKIEGSCSGQRNGGWDWYFDLLDSLSEEEANAEFQSKETPDETSDSHFDDSDSDADMIDAQVAYYRKPEESGSDFDSPPSSPSQFNSSNHFDSSRDVENFLHLFMESPSRGTTDRQKHRVSGSGTVRPKHGRKDNNRGRRKVSSKIVRPQVETPAHLVGMSTTSRYDTPRPVAHRTPGNWPAQIKKSYIVVDANVQPEEHSRVPECDVSSGKDRSIKEEEREVPAMENRHIQSAPPVWDNKSPHLNAPKKRWLALSRMEENIEKRQCLGPNVRDHDPK
ncbi:uncharacterized protein LOC127249884 [Andrographis paniculata]|uniref:uncharacterized protein LOC127249884 n=1 Tax=Andrographis paniculata TaxID=175694 RepID=UPI0021E8C06A|nr:uncharacterized protein LOC127249884 [Andrographis paniculata]